MDDDFSVPQALAVIHETVRAGNAALAEADNATVQSSLAATVSMLDVLGINPLAAPWSIAASAQDQRGVIDSLVQVVLDQRADARARKDFAAADAIRDGLQSIGISIEDTAAGVRWSLENRDGR
jgi:cysteinyl-tRNA synthetase